MDDPEDPLPMHAFVLPDGPDRGKRIAFTEESLGSRGAPQSLVFVHGNPESSLAFRDVLADLRERELPRVRVLALDHVGFGRSDPASYPMDPHDHARNLVLWLRHLAPERITLVVHDWGGPIGLGAMLDMPERLAKLLVLNSSILPLPSPGPTYRDHPFPVLSWARAADLVPDRWWGAFAAGAIRCRAASRAGLVSTWLRRLVRAGRRTRHDDPLRSPFREAANVASSKHLVRLAATWCEVRDGQPSALNRLYGRLRSEASGHWGPAGTRIEARLLAGGWDPLGSGGCVAGWLRVLPQLEGRIVRYPEEGHFLPVHRPREVADAVSALLRADGHDRPSARDLGTGEWR